MSDLVFTHCIEVFGEQRLRMASRRYVDSAFAAEVNSPFGDRGMPLQPSRVEARTDLYDFFSAGRQTQQYGFEQVDDDIYKVHFRDVEIGEFDAEALRFRPIQVMR